VEGCARGPELSWAIIKFMMGFLVGRHVSIFREIRKGWKKGGVGKRGTRRKKALLVRLERTCEKRTILLEEEFCESKPERGRQGKMKKNIVTEIPGILRCGKKLR